MRKMHQTINNSFLAKRAKSYVNFRSTGNDLFSYSTKVSNWNLEKKYAIQIRKDYKEFSRTTTAQVNCLIQLAKRYSVDIEFVEYK
jgi:hypothetical protein